MATRLEPPEPMLAVSTPTPMPEQPEWAPDEGMVFDTVLVREERTCWMAMERPKDWTPAQVTKALQARRDSISQAARWYESAPVTTIVEVKLEVFEPDTDARPFALSDEDLGAPPPIKVTKG